MKAVVQTDLAQLRKEKERKETELADAYEAIAAQHEMILALQAELDALKGGKS